MNTMVKRLMEYLNRKKPNDLLKDGWISVDNLPTESMKVRWICKDGVEDVGFYYSEQKKFASWDLCSIEPVTHWKPF